MFTLQSQAPTCAIIDSWSNSTAPNFSPNSSQTARVQKFTSIVTETQSSDIQFFPEIIQYKSDQQPSSSIPLSHLYKVQTSCPTEEQLRVPRLYARAGQRTQIHCDDNKYVDASLNSGGLECITSQAKHFLKDYRGDTNNPRGINIGSESQKYTFHLHQTTRDKKPSASELTTFCPQSSKLLVNNIVPDCYTHGKENVYNTDDQFSAINLTVEKGIKSVMEECSSVSNQIYEESNSVSVDSNQFASTSKTEKVDELNRCGSDVHPIPHHSLTVTLSDLDPESSSSHQVCFH